MPAPDCGERPDVFAAGVHQLVHGFLHESGTVGFGSRVAKVKLSSAAPFVPLLVLQRPDRVVEGVRIAPGHLLGNLSKYQI